MNYNAFINMFSTRGVIGLLAISLVVYGLFYRRIILFPDLNIGMFIFAALVMFGSAGSTIGGLTYNSLVFLMAVTLPNMNAKHTIRVQKFLKISKIQ